MHLFAKRTQGENLAADYSEQYDYHNFYKPNNSHDEHTIAKTDTHLLGNQTTNQLWYAEISWNDIDISRKYERSCIQTYSRNSNRLTNCAEAEVIYANEEKEMRNAQRCNLRQ